MIRIKPLYYLLTLLFLALVVALSIYIYQIRHNMQSNLYWSNKIDTLKLMNKDVDTFMSQMMNYYNYDHMTQLIKKFQTIMKEFENDPGLYDFFQNETYKESFERVKVGFRRKEVLLLRFMSYNAILNNSLRYSSFLFVNVEEDDKSLYQIRYIATLHNDILKMGLHLDVDKSSIREKLNHIEEIPQKSDTLKQYLNHISVIMHYFEMLKHNELENDRVKLDDKLQTLADNLERYFSTLIDSLAYVFIFLMSALFAFAGALIFLFIKRTFSEAKLRQFKNAIQNSDNTMIITDSRFVIEYVNDAFHNKFLFRTDEVIGKTPRIIQSGLHDQQFYEALKQTILSGKRWNGELVSKNKEGALIYEKSSILPIKDENGKIANFLAIKLDITKEKHYLKEIEEKSDELAERFYKDSLTGLGNRNLMIEYLQNRHRGVVIFIDINDFNGLKYFYGFDRVNAILVQLSNYLKQFALENEIESVFRIQSDDYCFWSEKHAAMHAQPSFIERLNRYLEGQNYAIDENRIDLDFTYGVSSADESLSKQTSKYLQAELAHHYARRHNLQYAIYDKQKNLDSEYHNNLLVTRMVNSALKEGRVIVHFQPIFYVDSKQVYSYEALVRIIDENGEVVYPGTFLEVTKRSMLYHKVTERVIDKTFQTAMLQPDKCFSINLSSLDFSNEKTISYIINALSTLPNPSQITFEILESESFESFSEFEEFVKKIKAKGCRVAIDDFGSGYSNFSRLLEFDVDVLKIDGSIIKSIDTSNESQILVETIMTLANKMGYTVVAEFVHSQSVLNKVREYKIDFAQGFFLGKPSAELISNA